MTPLAGFASRVPRRGVRKQAVHCSRFSQQATAVFTALLAGFSSGVARAAEGSRSGSVTIVSETYLGWPNTYRLDNGLIRARVVTAIGPRIVELGLKDGKNVFYVRGEETGGSAEKDWMFRGGWRLWVSPERKETTYALDNTACEAEIVGGNTLRVTAPAQDAARIRKQIDVRLEAGEPRLRLVSRIRNVGDTNLRYAAWSLSVLRPGGSAFVPLDVGPLTAFDAIRRLILWSYAEMDDPRYRFGNRLVQIDHSRVPPAPPDPSGRRDDESKIGVDSAQGWAAYLLGETLYMKRFPHDPTGEYPDGGATIEVYSSHEFLELENLGPLTTIAPGEEIVYAEDWWLFPDVHVRSGEKEALADLQPYLNASGKLPSR